MTCFSIFAKDLLLKILKRIVLIVMIQSCSEAVKAKAKKNVVDALDSEKSKTRQFDAASNSQELLRLSEVPENMEHPQPSIFKGSLKGYQLKGMNWLANLYDQVRRANHREYFMADFANENFDGKKFYFSRELVEFWPMKWVLAKLCSPLHFYVTLQRNTVRFLLQYEIFLSFIIKLTICIIQQLSGALFSSFLQLRLCTIGNRRWPGLCRSSKSYLTGAILKSAKYSGNSGRQRTCTRKRPRFTW